MIPTWLERGAAFAVLWFALALVIGVTLAAVIHYGNPTDEIADADLAEWEHELDPPEYEPDDSEAQRIAEIFAESAQEGPLFDPWEPTND